MANAGGNSAGNSERLRLLVIGPQGEPFWRGLAAVADVAEVTIGEDEETITAHLPAAEAVYVWNNSPLLERYWERARALRWVHAAWAGVDRLLFPGLVASDVVLTRTRGVYGSSLAEYALAAMLYFAKRVPELADYQRQRTWHKITPTDLAGKTLGIVGLGDVGLAVAAKGKALGMRVVGLRRGGGEPPEGVDQLLPLSSLHELLGAADYVVLCTPLTPQTKGLIGARELAAMKPSAVLVNIARGGVVQEDALLAALQAGRLAGAAVDVFETEPLPPESPFWDAPNVLISSHTVDVVPGWEERAVGAFVDNLRRYVAGRPLLNVVDKRRGY